MGLALLATAVRAEAPPPVVVALVFDTSGSLRPADVDAARELSTGLLKALPEGSQAAVLAFADESQLVLPRTADLAAIERAVSSLRPTGRTTALYDALYDASRYLRDAAASQRAVVLLTDGLDEGSALSVEDGLKVAQETHIPVFCVGVGKVQERVLRRVAKLTSGEYVPIAETTGGSLAARILEEKPELVGLFERLLEAHDPGLYIRNMNALLVASATDVVPTVTVPCLSISGTEDAYAPPDFVSAFIARLPQPCAQVLLDGVGHMPFFEAPSEFARAVGTFLEGNKGP
jgi:pimeloyl-ACP methyl ester carboxylesterase